MVVAEPVAPPLMWIAGQRAIGPGVAACQQVRARVTGQLPQPAPRTRAPVWDPRTRAGDSTGATRTPRARPWPYQPAAHIGGRPAPRRGRRPWPPREGRRMPTITVGQENNTDIEIYYEDHGVGQPVVLI